MPLDLRKLAAGPTQARSMVFDEPWEASVFAIVVQLCESGHYNWQEWVTCYTAEINLHEAALSAGSEINYYEVWVSALEKMTVERGLIDSGQIDDEASVIREQLLNHSHAAKTEPICVD